MARAFLFVLDSFGVGGAKDAAQFGDEGSDTLGHIAGACQSGGADKAGLRQGPLRMPNMERLGLGLASHASNGLLPSGFSGDIAATGLWGYGCERSKGKDTPSGHWEIAGVPVPYEWGYFPDTQPTFPEKLVTDLVQQASLPGILGDKRASGTEIIAELGDDHVSSGKPICYTSADSVFQIAAHEEHFGLERLYEVCEVARKLVDPLTIGRVIARPFVGSNAKDFERTANRRDYAVMPPEPTLLDRLTKAGRTVYGVGKISDIFAHSGVGVSRKAAGNDALTDTTLATMDDAGDGDLVFTNFIDFDSLYGHRRDVPGYAGALEAFDRRLPEIIAKLKPDDLVVLTADHGCDPTWPGTDHTRENVPILAFGPDISAGSIGGRPTFADIGETIADHLGIAPGEHGNSFLQKGSTI